MIFFVAMGLMFGIINLILLQLGARRCLSAPKLHSILSVSGWRYLSQFILSIWRIWRRIGLAYPPLSELAYSPGPGVDYWLWSIQIAGIGSTLCA